jgi:isopenicillin N synthase-like dioxygenase
LPGFRETMNSYFSSLLDLSTRLMRGLALSLELDEQYFGGFCKPPTSAVLRLLHYPQQPANPKPDEKGCGAHTDFGGLTLLLQDDAGGLQVFRKNVGWIHAPPLPGTYVVNLGDMISRWTNDRYRSTMHRVINVSGRDRYSVPFFFSGNQDYVVSCLPNCLDERDQPHYPPTTVEDHLIEMYRRTYAK